MVREENHRTQQEVQGAASLTGQAAKQRHSQVATAFDCNRRLLYLIKLTRTVQKIVGFFRFFRDELA